MSLEERASKSAKRVKKFSIEDAQRNQSALLNLVLSQLKTRFRKHLVWNVIPAVLIKDCYIYTNLVSIWSHFLRVVGDH